MKYIYFKYLYIIVAFFILASNTYAQERFALVIGNENYSSVPSLDNPVNDAKDMAIVLENLGFKVILKLNLNSKKAMIKAMREFERNLRGDDIALFYYSGHGLQSNNNHNYLIPVNADIKAHEDIDDQGFKVGYVLEKLQRINFKGVNILILDACRDNPFKTNIKSIKKGLAQIKNHPIGSLVAYATAPNMASYGDSRWRNSIYTTYLLNALRDKNKVAISILDMLTEVTNKVVKETDGEQVPWKSDSLTKRFCFGKCGAWCPECSQLLSVCEIHFKANRLTSGAGGTALECYKQVLKKDQSNIEALAGLDKIEERYVTWIEAALSKNNLKKAKQYLESLRQVKPESPKLVALEERIYPIPKQEKIEITTPPVKPIITPSIEENISTPSFFGKIWDSMMQLIASVWQIILIVVMVIFLIWLGLQQKPDRQLSALNPLDYFRLLWWFLVMPQQLLAYQKQFGEEDEKRVGKWLASTLVWLPLLIPLLALGLEMLPNSNQELSTDAYFQWSATVFVCWVFTGWLGNVENELAGEVAVFVALFVALVVAGGVAGFVAFFVANWVSDWVKKSLKTGTPSILARIAFALLVISYIFLIFYCFLGGWQLFV